MVRRILDHMLHDVMAALCQQLSFPFDGMILSAFDPMTIVDLEDAH
jgi:hypothetical protein